MDENSSLYLSRRNFIVTGLTAAGGLAIGLSALARDAGAGIIGPRPYDDDGHAPNEIDAWIAIEPDDNVLIRYSRSEMGQGSMTALPMMVAEELQCDWSKVRVEYASPNRNLRENNVYGDMSSHGSHSVVLSHEKMAQVGASARERLIAAAARKWGVEPASCAAAQSVVTHAASGRSLRYGELAADAAQIKLDKEPAIKKPEQWSFIGKDVPRVDVPAKINGSAQYAMDTRIPDMVFAAIAACPVPGGTLKSVDESPLKDAHGIVGVVKLQNAVAVVATETFWRAKQALARLQPEWDYGTGAGTSSEQFALEYREALDGKGVVARNDGNIDDSLSKASKVIEAVYEVPYLAHAAMEPLNATVDLKPDRLDLWIGSQAADGTTKNAARIAGLKPEQVYVHNCFLGGGFGRRGFNDEMVQAILVAKQIGKPVKLIWTREDDMRQDRYRPQAAVRMRAGLGPDGMPVAWHMKTAVGSLLRSLGVSKVDNGVEPMAVEGLADNAYNVTNTRVECVLKNTHVPVSFWRSVGHSHNGFIIESFVDELAAAGGHDPYQFRRKLLEGKKDWLGVLDTVAEKGDWGKPLDKGRARGIAIHESFGTIVGEVAEVSVSPKGEVRVHKVTVAVDCGHSVNTLTTAEQMEGAVIFGLTAALYGKATVKDGAIVQGNFDTYRMVRLAQAPKTDVHFVLSGGTKWGGVGEPGTPPIAPAVTNAIFAITGKRIRSLPIMDHDLSGSA